MTTLAERMAGLLQGRGGTPLYALWDEPGLRTRLWDEIGRDRVGLLSVQPVCRLEHPHCAFYRSGRQEELVRTTLHTPEGSLFQEAAADDPAVIHRYYVSRPERYGLLLAFLKDIVVTEDPHSLPRAQEQVADQGLVWALAPSAPADEMAARWRGAEALAAELPAPPDKLKPCLRQMRRNFEAQLPFLADRARGLAGVWLAWGSLTGPLVPEDFLRHSQPLYRQLYDAAGRAPIMVPVRGGRALAAFREQPASVSIRGGIPFLVPEAEDALPLTALPLPRAVELPLSLCLEPDRLARTLPGLAGETPPLWVLPAALAPDAALAALHALLRQDENA